MALSLIKRFNKMLSCLISLYALHIAAEMRQPQHVSPGRNTGIQVFKPLITLRGEAATHCMAYAQ